MINYIRINPLNCVIDSENGQGQVYIGNIYAAYSLDILQKHNIKAVLTIAAGTQLKYSPENQINHLIIAADDVESFILSRHFERIVDFIDSNRKSGANVLVHCFAGISRSSSGVIAYMIKKLNYSYRDAVIRCKARRKEVFPNRGFIKQLQQFEARVRNSENQKKRAESLIQVQTLRNSGFEYQQGRQISEDINQLLDVHKKIQDKNLSQSQFVEPMLFKQVKKQQETRQNIILNTQSNSQKNSPVKTVKAQQEFRSDKKIYENLQQDTKINNFVRQTQPQRINQKSNNISPQKIMSFREYNQQQKQSNPYGRYTQLYKYY